MGRVLTVMPARRSSRRAPSSAAASASLRPVAAARAAGLPPCRLPSPPWTSARVASRALEMALTCERR